MARIALDLKTYGPRYAQFQIVNVDEPLVDAAISLTLVPRLPSAERQNPPTEPYHVVFKRGYVAPGEEILICPPPEHEHDHAGMEMPFLLDDYAEVIVTVERLPEEPLVAGIPDLKAYWDGLAAANVMERSDPADELRSTLSSTSARITRALEQHAERIESSVARLNAGRSRQAWPVPKPTLGERIRALFSRTVQS